MPVWGFCKAAARPEVQNSDTNNCGDVCSNTMDNMNNNDPMKKLLNGIPTWRKVREPVDVRALRRVGGAASVR